MKKFLFPLMMLLSLAAVTLRADDKKPVVEVAVIKTTAGDMVLGFWPDVAPGTVENFKKLAKAGYFDGIGFHRIIKGFMIQGGDPKTKDPAKEVEWGTGGPGYTIKDEFNEKKHELGVISMANTGRPDSAGSQFFLCLGTADSPRMQGLNGHYTAFGKLIKGEDVLLKIGDSEVVQGGDPMPSKPVKLVKIISIKIVPADSVK
jgi:peptidyl-prolyl cis-trans isomerase B (cyclophilin B)